MRKKLVFGLLSLVALIVLAAGGFLVYAVSQTRSLCPHDYTAPDNAINQANAKSETTLKVLTWNIQMLPTLFGGLSEKLDKMQLERAPWIVDYLKQQDYDVVCFQEAFDPRAVQALVEGLRPVYPHVVLPRYSGHFWQLSNGVLFVSRVPITFKAGVVFKENHGIDSMAAKGCTLIEGRKDGLVFQMAGTHFPTGKGVYKKTDCEQTVKELLAPNRRARVPQFFVGDFNIKKDSEEYVFLMKATGMSESAIDDPRPYSSDFKNSWKKPSDGPGNKLALIDHILLDPQGTKTAIRVQHIQRATHEYNGKTIDLSDHYGVSAEAVISN